MDVEVMESSAPAAAAAHSARAGQAGGDPWSPSPSPAAPVTGRRPTRAVDTRSKSPLLAGILSLMPGLGQIFVGYYQRGFIHAAVVASVITLMDSGEPKALIPFFGFFLAFFWMYNVIDAARLAALYNRAMEGEGLGELPPAFKLADGGGSIFVGVLFVLAGGILLLHTRFGMPLDWLRDWWPVAVVLVGAYLIYREIRSRSAASAAGRD